MSDHFKNWLKIFVVKPLPSKVKDFDPEDLDKNVLVELCKGGMEELYRHCKRHDFENDFILCAERRFFFVLFEMLNLNGQTVVNLVDNPNESFAVIVRKAINDCRRSYKQNKQ